MIGFVIATIEQMLRGGTKWDGEYDPAWGPVKITDGGQQTVGIQRAMMESGPCNDYMRRSSTPYVVLYAGKNMSTGDKAFVSFHPFSYYHYHGC